MRILPTYSHELVFSGVFTTPAAFSTPCNDDGVLILETHPKLQYYCIGLAGKRKSAEGSCFF